MAKKYKKKGNPAEAVQFTGSNQQELLAFAPIVSSGNDLTLIGGNAPKIATTDWVMNDSGHFVQFTNANFVANYDEQPGP